MTFGSLFAGIGGIDRGLEAAGMTCKWHVEIDDFCQRVLYKHWSDVPKHRDIRTFQPTYVDVVAGGFPCQDISQAGKRAGLDGKRSGLWSEFFRVIREVRPRFVLVENVAALLVRGMDRVLGDLSTIGYDAEWQSIRASDFALPHRRERVFIVSYPNQQYESPWLGNGIRKGETIFTIDHAERQPVRVETTTTTDRMDDGVSSWLYRRGVGAYGNAVVPQAAEWIGRRIMESSNANCSD